MILALLLCASDPRQALEETVRAYEAAVQAMQSEVKAQVERTYAQRKDEISVAFEAHIRELEVVERQRRGEAIAQFEAFLQRYPNQPLYSPDAMFRLAELYFERSSDEFFVAMQAWQTALKNAKNGEEPAQPKHEYHDAIALYDKLIADFPDYRLIDGAYYLLGYCQGEQGDEEIATRTFETLVAKFPDSRFVPEAYTRIGEYYFDANALTKAAAAYEQVLRYKDSPFYDKALYKLACDYYRKFLFEEGLKRFTELVDFADANKSEGKGNDLRGEAIQYMGISFAEETWGGVDKAQAFFTAAPRPWAFEVFTMLGDVYFDQTKYPEAVRAYAMALEKNPNNPDAPKLQDKIVQAYERSRDFDHAAKAREQLAQAYSENSAWALANKDNTDAVAAARDISERSLLAAAVFHHRQAQAYREAKKNDLARDEYALAATGYAAYVRRFPAAKNRYDLSYYLADCQYYSLQFADAAESYAKVRDDDSSDTHREPAAFSAVLACEREIQVEEQKRILPPRPILKSADRPASLPVQVENLPEPKLRLVEACDAYLARAPATDASQAASDKSAAVAYKAAEVFYASDNFEEARRRFAEIMARFPKSDVARYAANLTIESYLAEKRFAEVEKFSRDALANTDIGHGNTGFSGDLQKFKLGAMFKQAEALDEQKQYEAAAQSYIRLVDENPKGTFADKALNNAAVAFEKAHRYESAMKLYERVYHDFPNSPLADYALFRVGVNAGRFYEFSRAIDSYLALVDKYEKSEHRPDALYNAALALENTQQYKRAEDEYQRYAKLFPSREDAPEVFFRSARAAQNASEPERAIQIYGEFAKKYGKTKGQDERVVEAWFESGQLLADQHDDKAARKAYATAVSEANHRGKGQAFAAHAQFAVADLAFADYDAVKVEGASKAQKDAIVKRSKLLTSVRDEFQKVFPFKQVEWTLASLYRIGSLYESFADMLFAAPPPPEIKKLGPDYVEEYRVLLEEKAVPLEDKAVEAYKRTIEEAKKASVGNAWTKRTLVSLNKLRKKEFPLQKDAKFSVELVPIAIPALPSSMPTESAK